MKKPTSKVAHNWPQFVFQRYVMYNNFAYTLAKEEEMQQIVSDQCTITTMA